VSERVPASLLSALADLVKWLETMPESAMVIGGVAASFLGRPRLTQDIDALVILPKESWDSALASAQSFGLAPRIENAMEFAHRSRVLLLRHAHSGIDIDVSFGGLQFEQEALEKSKVYNVGGAQVRLPRVEDLVIMKAVARRPKDLQDIEGLLEANPNIDLESVRRWVHEFATAMAMPDMIEDLEKIIVQTRPK
jgi:hypothetical protein